MKEIYFTEKSRIIDDYKKERVITGIKNPDFKIFFLRKSVILGFICFFLCICFSIIYIYKSISFKICLYLLVLMCSFIFTLLYYLCTIYFDGNNLIMKNMLGKKICIDVTRYPRIYIEKRVHKDVERRELII